MQNFLKYFPENGNLVFCDINLGKTVIETKDTPEAAAKSAELALKLCQKIEEVDDISDDISDIIDIFGRSVYTSILENSSSSSEHTIDISNSNDGIYIVQLVQGDKKTMKKIVKE